MWSHLYEIWPGIWTLTLYHTSAVGRIQNSAYRKYSHMHVRRTGWELGKYSREESFKYVSKNVLMKQWCPYD